MEEELLKIINHLRTEIYKKENIIKAKDSTIFKLVAEICPILSYKLLMLGEEELLLLYRNKVRKTDKTKFPVQIKTENLEEEEYKSVHDLIEKIQEFDRRLSEMRSEMCSKIEDADKTKRNLDESVRIIFKGNVPLFCLYDILKLCGKTITAKDVPSKAEKLSYTFIRESLGNELWFINKPTALKIMENYGIEPSPFMLELNSDIVRPVAFIKRNHFVKENRE